MKTIQLAISMATLMVFVNPGYAQNDDQGKSALFAEFMGNGIIYSLGYEKVLVGKSRDVLAVRVGLCLYPQKMGNASALFRSLPVEFVSRQLHKNLELGVGYTPFFNTVFIPMGTLTERQFTKDQSWEHKVFARIGYMSTPGPRGLFWKAAFVPDVYDSRDKKNNFIGFGLGVGRVF